MSGQDTPRALSIRELPRSERPRERLVDLGAQALSSAELLAILLGSGGLGRTALQLGQSVLAGAGGSLRRIAMQPVAALTSLTGVGTARAATVHAALELGRRMAAESREDGAPVRSPRDVVELFAARLEDLPVEEFHVAVLDSQHRLERDVSPGWREDEHPLNDKLDRELLVRAYQFGEQAHRGQVRNSGEPFITHSVEVAKILADLQLDSTTVACGLLHDVVEDTKIAI